MLVKWWGGGGEEGKLTLGMTCACFPTIAIELIIFSACSPVHRRTRTIVVVDLLKMAARNNDRSVIGFNPLPVYLNVCEGW